ncbi:MAG: pyrroline-5-carboxylate reductase [Alphaproteobacteria bacterium]
MKPDTKLLLVGCGKMGGAILQRIASSATTYVVEPNSPPAELQKLPSITWVTSFDKIDASFKPDIIVLAIKPQHVSTTLPNYASYKESVLLSILAGTSLATLEKLWGTSRAIVRSMPNLSASIGEGMSVAVANPFVSAHQHQLCDDILKAVGDVAWVEDEHLIDAATALSGSGPAYVFALCEAMTKAGTALGFSEVMAKQLAQKTLSGSAALLTQSKEDATYLRNAVTSPGGTTEAALKELLGPTGLFDLMHKTLQAALKRAKELAKLA